MRATCAFCGFDFDASNGSHGCPESRMNPNLVERLRDDHRDTIECEHGFMLHRDPCPNVVCLGRDLAEAADEIERLRDIIRNLRMVITGVTPNEYPGGDDGILAFEASTLAAAEAATSTTHFG